MARDKNATGVPMRTNNESSGFGAHGEVIPERIGDDSLAAAVARGDNAALETLYDRYAATVFGIALKVIGDQAMAEDVLQETFWRVWKSAVTYQPGRGSFTSWLFRIARNLAIDAYRRRNVRPQVLFTTDEDEPILDKIADPDMDVAAKATALLQSQQVRRAMSALSPPQRQVIELAYFYGMTRQEIADVTGEALGTIHTRARLALQKLRQELEKEDFEG